MRIGGRPAAVKGGGGGDAGGDIRIGAVGDSTGYTIWPGRAFIVGEPIGYRYGGCMPTW